MHSKSSNLKAILKNRLPSDRSLAESNMFCSIKGSWCVLCTSVNSNMFCSVQLKVCTSLESNMFCSVQLKVCTSVDLPIKFFLQSIKVFRSNRLHLSEAATEYTVIELDQPKHTNNINLHYRVSKKKLSLVENSRGKCNSCGWEIQWDFLINPDCCVAF